MREMVRSGTQLDGTVVAAVARYCVLPLLLLMQLWLMLLFLLVTAHLWSVVDGCCCGGVSGCCCGCFWLLVVLMCCDADAGADCP